MTGLEQALVAVAVNLVSGGLIGAAKAAWARLKESLTSQGDERVKAWLNVLEADPSEELARNIAERIRAIGLDKTPEVQNAASACYQLAFGTGATSAAVGTNYGTIGGNHLHVNSAKMLSLNAGGRSFFHLVNNTLSTIAVSSVQTNGALDRLEILVPLPAVLEPGAGIPLIADQALGTGPAQLMVQFFRDGVSQHENLFLNQQRIEG